ncbi:MAG: winged helix-turn-helix domain-containing protein, partial [Pseudomonadota bacterium]
MISIKLFGKFSVHDAQGNPIAIAGSKTQGLLAFLALNAELPPTRDRIISLFWGERFNDQARQSLRQALRKLRQLLDDAEGEALVVDQERIGLNPAVVEVDVEAFVSAASQGDLATTRAAAAMLTGPMLDGLYGMQPEFDDWLALERQRINELAVKVLERSAEQELQQGDPETALERA